jgi:hypothetical protein
MGIAMRCRGRERGGEGRICSMKGITYEEILHAVASAFVFDMCYVC